MEKPTGGTRGTRIGARVSVQDQREIERLAKTRGYSSPSAFIRAAIRNEIRGREDLVGIEERISGSFERLSHEKLADRSGAPGSVRPGRRTEQDRSHLHPRTDRGGETSGSGACPGAVSPVDQVGRCGDVGRCPRNHGRTTQS